MFFGQATDPQFLIFHLAPDHRDQVVAGEEGALDGLDLLRCQSALTWASEAVECLLYAYADITTPFGIPEHFGQEALRKRAGEARIREGHGIPERE